MLLDVGSGDPCSPFHSFLEGKDIIHLDLNKSAYCVETQASALKLPFKTNSFSVVHASHILEHLFDPMQALRELSRVSSHTVIINVPNASRNFWHESPEHIFSWNKYTLTALLSRVFKTVNLTCVERVLPRTSLKNRVKHLVYSALFKPSQLHAVCTVKK